MWCGWRGHSGADSRRMVYIRDYPPWFKAPKHHAFIEVSVKENLFFDRLQHV